VKRLDIDRAKRQVRAACAPGYRGRVERVSGLLVEAHGVPATVGETCRIRRSGGDSVDAEVIGFDGARTLLMPHSELVGIGPTQEVVALGRPFSIFVGDELLGRAVDGFGRPIDGRGPLGARRERPVRGPGPDPLTRRPIKEPLQTGVRVIDGLNTIGRGQRVGIFAGSGVGKSTLLAQVARGTDAQVLITALVGERGREVGAYVRDVLEPRGLKHCVLVASTSDRPPIERFLAPFTATAIAESFREQGLDVLLVLDSITRFAAASREIGLAAGEPPTVRGYPPSFFATVPRLLERLGTAQRGSITALLTVLLDGDDPNDPVSDTLRGLLDGHLVLSRDLAGRGHWPAVDVLAGLSRLMPELVDAGHLRAATRVRHWLAAHRDGRDLVEIGAYKPGTNAALDEALARMPAIEAFLRQGPRETSALAETRELLDLVTRGAGGAP
jgi:flagellum-specific ATP synthase